MLRTGYVTHVDGGLVLLRRRTGRPLICRSYPVLDLNRRTLHTEALFWGFRLQGRNVGNNASGCELPLCFI